MLVAMVQSYNSSFWFLIFNIVIIRYRMKLRQHVMIHRSSSDTDESINYMFVFSGNLQL